LSAGAQPFINEINYFKKLDSLNAPPAHPILFIGSSSFTRWKDVQEYFPSHIILNRGFGGSSLPHLIRYAEDVIFKYHPKQIVIYCGENDLTGGNQVTGQTVFERFRELYSLIRSRLPKVPIVYVSMKPSPSREKYLPAMEEGNRLIRKFCKKKKRTEFADVFHSMLTPEGKIRPDIFASDNLHMNEKGYTIWQPIIEPYLKD
jgi:lysophospholipase L1-like esterase